MSDPGSRLTRRAGAAGDEVTVRPARPADRDAAVALYASLHREHEALDPRYRLADDALARWATDVRDWTRSRADAVWLAETSAGHPGSPGRAAVGLLTAHLFQPSPMFRAHTFVWVDDLYVAPPLRGRGVGRRLLDAARAWGRERGAVELRAGVLAANAGARRFWSREGAADVSVTVAAPL